VPEIFLALEGKYDFVMKTNPFGAPKDPLKEKVRQEKLSTQRAAFAMAKAEARQKVKDGRRN